MSSMLQNPVLTGFHPDPSVCRVGRDYFLACSSFEFFPGVPLFHSRDLAGWQPIGHALDRPSQLPLAACGASGGIFAPTIRHHAGIFYLITTNVGGGGNFLVTATDPAGRWSDPVWIDDAWFDPSLLFDAGGKVFYTRRGGDSAIVQAEIDVATGRLLTPLREISSGFVSPDCEGPHLYHIGEWYYLLLAEGGSRTGHMATLGRSRTPWGPFSPAPHNPILSNRLLTNNPVRSVGHAELFQAHDKSWWLACLGTRHETYEPYGLLGRESYILPVAWDDDGWPIINNGLPVTLDPVALPWPAEPLSGRSRSITRWEFSKTASALDDPGWLSPRARVGINHPPGQSLRVAAVTDTLNDPGAPAFLGRRVPSLHATFSARLSSLDGGECGIALYLDHRHHLDLVVAGPACGRRLEARLRLGDAKSLLAGLRVPSGPLELRLLLDGIRATGEVVLTSGEAVNLGTWDIRYLAPEVAGAWTGLVAAAFAQLGSIADISSFDLAAANGTGLRLASEKG